MKKINSLFLLATSSLVLSACGVSGQGSEVKQTKTEVAKEATKIGEILAKGGSASCQITSVEDKLSYNLAISGKKMRMTGMKVMEGKSGSMINDGEYIYIWEDGKTTGVKMKLPSEAEAQKAKEEASKLSGDYEAAKIANQYDDSSKFSLDCKEGKIEDSQFVAPSAIKFLDTSAMMPKVIPSVPKGVDIPGGIPTMPSRN